MQNKDILLCECHETHSDKINIAKSKMIDEETIFELADFFKIFGDSTRIKILWALDTQELCVCDLASLLNMTKSAISHQLRVLRQDSLVKYRKDGKNVFYSINDDHIKTIIENGLSHINEG